MLLGKVKKFRLAPGMQKLPVRHPELPYVSSPFQSFRLVLEKQWTISQLTPSTSRSTYRYTPVLLTNIVRIAASQFTYKKSPGKMPGLSFRSGTSLDTWIQN
jgi:hypothetical protein